LCLFARFHPSVASRYANESLIQISLHPDGKVGDILTELKVTNALAHAGVYQVSFQGARLCLKDFLADCGLSSECTVEIESVYTRPQIDAMVARMCRAAMDGHLASIVELFESGVSADVADKHGITPLHRAAHSGFQDIVVTLLDRGANINAVDNFQQTALHWAAVRERVEIVELLLQRGANAQARDLDGHTPLECVRASLKKDAEDSEGQRESLMTMNVIKALKDHLFPSSRRQPSMP